MIKRDAKVKESGKKGAPKQADAKSDDKLDWADTVRVTGSAETLSASDPVALSYNLSEKRRIL